MQEGGLVCHVHVNSCGCLRDDCVSAFEMLRISPTIIIIKEAEIRRVGRRSAEIVRIRPSVPIGPIHETATTDAPSSEFTHNGVVGALMLFTGAVIHDDNF